MPRPLRSRTVLSMSIASCALIAATAHAQPALVEGSFSLDRYEPTPYGDRFFAVQGAGTDSAAPFRIGVTLDFAKDPLLLQPRRENPDLEDEVVGNQLFGHLGLSYAFFDRILVSASMPFGFASSGNDPVSNSL